MKPTLLFICQEISTVERYKKLLNAAPYNIIWAEKLTSSPSNPIPDLVIFHENIAELPVEPQQHFPKQYTPLLFISDSPTVPPVLEDAILPYLTDFLGEQVPRSTLIAKINFLLRVGKIHAAHTTSLREHRSFLDWLTNHDALTGLYNRNQFNKVFPEQFTKAQQNGTELCLLILNIDYFSELNRLYSNEFGDTILNELAARLTQIADKNQTCFRFTGGDIIVLVPDTELAKAKELGETIRTACKEKVFISHEIEKKVTISVGIASTLSHKPASGDELFNMAETALYAAKSNGRNRCETYSPLIEGPSLDGKKNFDALRITLDRLLEKTRQSTISSLQLLTKDVAGKEHRDHINKVSQYALLLGKQLGLQKPMLETLQNAIIIQTSIRLLIHRDLISKPIELDSVEKQILNELPCKISELMESFNYFDQERHILTTRGEHFDGTGFPQGLQGHEIPLGARIINVIDSFAAMDTDRPFRTRMSPDSILQELENEAGKQFDPALVLAFFELIAQKNLLNVDEQRINAARDNLLAHFPELQS